MNMKVTTVKKINPKKSEIDFWKTIALQQQAIIHAKNRT